MAYAAVASLSQTIHLFLNYHHHSICPRFNDQITSLHKHTIFLQSFLEDFPLRATIWEEQIREVTTMAEEIIEILLSDSLLKLKLKLTAGSSKPNLEKGNNDLVYDSNELERVIAEIESITNRVKGKHAESMGGSNDELAEIISRLRGGSSSLEIISVFGMGGIGKTTLAGNAYNHPLIEEHFEIRAWSTVSRDCAPRRMILDLLRLVLKSNAGSTNTSNSEGALIEIVCKILRGKRYLIVIDDIWRLAAFEGLRCMLPDDGNGSRLILTTRLYNVAMTASHIHKMCLLDEDRAWNLLREKIFKGDPYPSQLEYIGKMIARSCRGHPLSIEVVSGILAVDQSEDAWEDISDEMSVGSENAGRVLSKVVSMSYTYLPHHLRPCFVYLASFQEDHEIYVSKLVRLWVAEGFLDQNGSKSFEETGEEHVRELVMRSLVSVSKRKRNGRIKSIRIHDVMRDMCLRQANVDNFVLHVGRFRREAMEMMELHSCRRVSVSDYTYGDDFLEDVYGSTIRTIMLYLDGSRLGLRLSFGNVRLLRILDVSDAYNCDLPEEVYYLFHLRYLAIDCRSSISEAITNLVNLQTLIICPRTMFATFKLPQGIWRMPQLRHLVMFLFELPSPTSALENLQTLSRVVNFRCSERNLKMIPNLKKMSIRYTVVSAKDVVEHFHNLKHMQKLENLKISMHWGWVSRRSAFPNAFPLRLKKLSLIDVNLSWEDMRFVGFLPYLEVLKLGYACTGDTWETIEGGFPRLIYLMINRSSLKNWITESSHFPRLKCLVLRLCWNLLDIGEISTLELIELDGKNQPLLESAKRIQKDRQSLGDDSLQIHVV